MRKYALRLFRFIIRSSAFMQKELVEVLRQPRLILTLVLGPFLILLLFGIGYANNARKLRTLFVVPSDSPMRSQVKQYAQTMGPQLEYAGTVDSTAEAMQQLKYGKVDLVVVGPDDVYQKIQNNQQATFVLYHNEIDPTQAGYVAFLGQLYVGELNRRVLQQVTSEGQQEATTLHSVLTDAQTKVDDMRATLQQGDLADAQAKQEELSNQLDLVTYVAGTTLGTMKWMDESIGDHTSANSLDVKSVQKLLDTLAQDKATLTALNLSDGNTQDAIQELDKTDENLSSLNDQLKSFEKISPFVLVNPFTSESKSLNGIQFSTTDFFAPGVIILLLQHLAVTSAALSFVREKLSGAKELFRVAPITIFETLLGKYLSYMLFISILSAGITGLVVWVLKVPMFGNWTAYAVVVILIIFASLGAGFLFSLLAHTETQAVQYSMLLLLVSVFFSGFFLDLRLMRPAVRILSWSLPATYGIHMLQNVMLRGELLNPLLLTGLAGAGIVLFLLSWMILKLQMRQK